MASVIPVLIAVSASAPWSHPWLGFHAQGCEEWFSFLVSREGPCKYAHQYVLNRGLVWRRFRYPDFLLCLQVQVPKWSSIRRRLVAVAQGWILYQSCIFHDEYDMIDSSSSSQHKQKYQWPQPSTCHEVSQCQVIICAALSWGPRLNQDSLESLYTRLSWMQDTFQYDSSEPGTEP